MSDEHDIIDAEVDDTAGDNALSLLRNEMTQATPEEVRQGLELYEQKRKVFRDWLDKQLVEGVHFGYPPGCKPSTDKDGNLLSYSRGKKTVVDKKQWQAKPTLYQAGADLVCDLLQLECEHECDKVAWEQLGSEKGMIVMNCTLRLKATGKVVGHGIGAAKVGEKSWNHNQATKMCRKRAKVCAVLDALSLSDLFTQDVHDPNDVPPRAENPPADDDAPKAQPRAERVTKQTLLDLAKRWTEVFGDAPPEERRDWLADVSGIDPEQVTHLSAWTMDAVRKCYAQIDKESNDIPY